MKTEMFLVLFAGGMLVAVSSQAQTNRAEVASPAALRIKAVHPAVKVIRTNASPNLATVEFKLPPGSSLNNYRVLEERAHVTRAVTNLAATSTNEISASVTVGSTLIFMEKGPSRPLKPAVRGGGGGQAQMFSTYFVKTMAPTRPGQPLRTASGTLNMVADTKPTLWYAASNAYIAHLTVVFLTDEPANNPLLPMDVELTGTHTRPIEPKIITLEKPNFEGGKEAVVTCDQYATDVQVTAHYLTASNTVSLELQKLTVPVMTQMIISIPMLFAVLTGGLIGGLLRLFKGAKWKMGRILHYLAEGVTVGLVTVTLLLAGLLHSQIAELPAQPQLVLAFALAAAAGSVGAHFLDKTVNHLRGK